MALDKAVTQKTAVVGKDNELRTQLVDLYRERVAGVDFAALDVRGTVEAFKDRSALASHLEDLGKERESNTIRKETVRILVSKAEASEVVAFDTMKKLTAAEEETREKRAALDEEMTQIKQTATQLQQDFAKKQEKHAQLDPASKEAVDLEAELKALNETFQTAAGRGTQIRKELQQMEQAVQSGSKVAQQAAQEALTFKTGAVSTLMVTGNFDGAFELALSTLDKFHAAGIYGLAEQLVANTVNMAEGKAENLFKEHKQQADIHKLLELGIEVSVDVAARLEKAVFEGRTDPEVLGGAAQFRLKAADLSAKKGDFADAKELLLSAAKEYKERGHTEQAVELLEFALSLDEANPFAEAKRGRELPNGGYL